MTNENVVANILLSSVLFSFYFPTDCGDFSNKHTLHLYQLSSSMNKVTDIFEITREIITVL